MVLYMYMVLCKDIYICTCCYFTDAGDGYVRGSVPLPWEKGIPECTTTTTTSTAKPSITTPVGGVTATPPTQAATTNAPPGTNRQGGGGNSGSTARLSVVLGALVGVLLVLL